MSAVRSFLDGRRSNSLCNSTLGAQTLISFSGHNWGIEVIVLLLLLYLMRVVGIEAVLGAKQ